MRILVIEDDPVLADALVHVLRSDGYAVDALGTGGQADLALTTETFDLVVLDIELPILDGFELLTRLRARKQTVPVLILTARDSISDRIHGLDIGADDYLTKPFEMGELLARTRALLRRAKGRAEDLMGFGELVIDMKGRSASLGSTRIELAAREWSVLELLVSRAGRVVSKDAIRNSVYDWDNDVGTNAVEILIHRIRKKLEGSSISISTVRGLGYLLDSDKSSNRAHWIAQ